MLLENCNIKITGENYSFEHLLCSLFCTLCIFCVISFCFIAGNLLLRIDFIFAIFVKSSAFFTDSNFALVFALLPLTDDCNIVSLSKNAASVFQQR
jgi:hypothetical protein